MSDPIEIKVPNIGDFDEVDVIEVMVAPGDRINSEDPLITVETDKAAMDVPATSPGTVRDVKVKTGDKVAEGDVIVVLEAEEGGGGSETEEKASEQGNGEEKKDAPAKQEKKEAPKDTGPAPKAAEYSGKADIECEVAVLGSGPGGYTAAFRAADLGKKVVLIERYPDIGGVCLNVGCIPSKALLHAAKVVDEAEYMSAHGIEFGKPKIDTDKLRDWKNDVVGKLTGGLKGLAKQRKVQIVQGTGRFVSDRHIEVEDPGSKNKPGKKKVVHFDNAIIAAGSSAAMLPDLPDDERIMTSTGALEMEELPKKVLVVGGGIIGLELATVYDALGVEIDVVELTDQLIPGGDADLIKPLQKRIEKRYGKIMLGSKVTKVQAQKQGIKVHFEGKSAPDSKVYGRVLVAVGRKPNGLLIDGHKAGVKVDERGFISVDKQMRTNVDHIFAIGDVVGEPMLAHKATHEGKVAAEVAAGQKRFFDARCIPSVAYTDPEVAWAGLTEKEAKEQGIDYEVGKFPWAASGRSLSLGRDEGFTKLLFEPKTDRILGGAMVGPNAGELIAEVALAIEMGADATDIGLTIHPHPTLSETVCFSAEAFEGTLTDLYVPKKKK